MQIIWFTSTLSLLAKLKLIQNYLRTLLLRKPLRFLRKYKSLGNSTTNSLLHHHTFQNLMIPMATSIMTAPLLQRLNLLMPHLYFERNAIVMGRHLENRESRLKESNSSMPFEFSTKPSSHRQPVMKTMSCVEYN